MFFTDWLIYKKEEVKDTLSVEGGIGIFATTQKLPSPKFVWGFFSKFSTIIEFFFVFLKPKGIEIYFGNEFLNKNPLECFPVTKI